MNKHILFISYDGMTDPLGQSQVIPYLAGLTKYGYTFTILSCDKPDKYALHKGYVQDLIEPYPIKWVSIPYHKRPAVLSSWYDYLMLKKTAIRLHRQAKFDLVHTRTGVPALVGYWLKKNFGIKFLNDIRGFWADERVDGGMWNTDQLVYKLVYRFFKKKEDDFINIADYNICLTFKAKEEIHTWDRINNQPIPLEVIPCCTDMELFDPCKMDLVEREQLKIELGIKDEDVIISYLGSIGGWYLTEEMMCFCKMLSEQVPRAKFLFISPHLHDVIDTAALKYGLPVDKLILKQGKRHEIPLLLSFSHYSVFFIKSCYSKISSSPTKHGEIMAMGIPVITNSGVGDVKEIIEKYESGYIVKDFSAKSFAEVIAAIKKGDLFNRTKIKKGAEEFYALHHAVSSYHKVYTNIFEQGLKGA